MYYQRCRSKTSNYLKKWGIYSSSKRSQHKFVLQRTVICKVSQDISNTLILLSKENQTYDKKDGHLLHNYVSKIWYEALQILILSSTGEIAEHQRNVKLWSDLSASHTPTHPFAEPLGRLDNRCLSCRVFQLRRSCIQLGFMLAASFAFGVELDRRNLPAGPHFGQEDGTSVSAGFALWRYWEPAHDDSCLALSRCFEMPTGEAAVSPFLAVPHYLKTHDKLKSTDVFRQRWRNHPGNTIFLCQATEFLVSRRITTRRFGGILSIKP